MLASILSPSLLAVILATGTASADEVGYFDSQSCVDPTGLEQCYEEISSSFASCVNDNCKDQNIDCTNVCSCIRTADEIDCAGKHCWNRVYSCEYQQTVSDLGTYCLEPRFEEAPFFPPPDDADGLGACSCNLGKVLTSLYRTSAETETCGSNGEDIASGLTSNDEIQSFTRACTCCSQSGMLSAFSAICPNTDPSLLGRDEIYQSLVANDEDWPMCATYMDAFPCESKLGYTPPGDDDDSGTFYEPDDFPADGTATLSNMAGVITAPIGGATYTWTHNGIERVITVASAEAKPTAAAGNDANNDSSENSDEKGNDGNSTTGSEDKKNSAAAMGSRLLPISCGMLLFLALVL
ncbi:hypothetical protein F5Y04DRAFT_123659 [Hypomontagnella monticulosa]|nr:hypothetical protein F5Y04DRAFT_123659 [Hypomontagnella monticulosa]